MNKLKGEGWRKKGYEHKWWDQNKVMPYTRSSLHAKCEQKDQWLSEKLNVGI